MYGMIKTHKFGISVRVITSACNAAVENLSILVEKTLYPIADKVPSKIKNTNDTLDIKDSINESVLTDNYVPVNFDVLNFFPNIDNKSDLNTVKDASFDNNFNLDSTQYIFYALEICLSCNNSKFNHQPFLQNDVTVQGPHMSCFYTDMDMTKYDCLPNKFHLRPSV